MLEQFLLQLVCLNRREVTKKTNLGTVEIKLEVRLVTDHVSIAIAREKQNSCVLYTLLKS